MSVALTKGEAHMLSEISVHVDERLPEGQKIMTALQRSGLDYIVIPSSGSLEVSFNGFRYVGLTNIRALIRRLRNK